VIELHSPPPRRLLLTGAGLAGVLLGLVLLVTVFGGAGDEQPVALRPGPTPASGPDPTVVEPPPVEVGTQPPPGEGRDPFRQIVTVPVEALTTGSPAPGPAPPTTGGPPAPEAPPVTEAPPATDAPPTTQPAPAPAEPVVGPGAPAGLRYAELELRSIFWDPAGVQRADLTVDGRPFQPAQGELFASGLFVERLDDRCLTVSAVERLELCLTPS
jgi:hypothetical protein